MWHLRSYAAARQVLRDAAGTRQGMLDELGTFGGRLRRPVFFQDGQAHREQRTAIARFFTPATVSGSYRGLMEALSDELVAELARRGGGELSSVTMQLAVAVAAQVVGLTDSRRPGMDRRIARLLSLDERRHPSRLRRTVANGGAAWHALRFYLIDVGPAIAARRRERREDVISHLLDGGYGRLEILVECMTYAAAGMITTREFLCMAAWHLLEDEKLRDAYLAADEAEGHRLLHEILRLEPVAGHLQRRAVRELRLEVGGETFTVPEGALLHLDLRAANADAEAVGAEPLRLCPQRDLARGVQPPVLSFGDGAHRCPGAFLAIHETDIFLQRLLRLPLAPVGEPRLVWNDDLDTYEVRDFVVEVAGEGPAA